MVSVLYREPKLLKSKFDHAHGYTPCVSVLYREPKLLKYRYRSTSGRGWCVSVLYREPKLLKYSTHIPKRSNIKLFQCSTVSRNC